MGIGILASMYTANWGLDYKINDKHQEILNLGDQIKHEESKIKSIKEKYSTIRFWQKKSREDIIEIEKAKTRKKILDARRSEAKDERANLKKAIGRSLIFRPIWMSPLFVPWVIIWVVYYFSILIIPVLKKS